jgi:hypothetical protein
VPRALLSALAPVRMMCEVSTWTTRWPRRTRYAPIPTDRALTRVNVTVSAYARDVSLMAKMSYGMGQHRLMFP